MGRRINGEKGADAALVYYERAIQLDPNFATGYAAVAADHGSLGELGRANEYFTKAFELRERHSLKLLSSLGIARCERVSTEGRDAEKWYATEAT